MDYDETDGEKIENEAVVDVDDNLIKKYAQKELSRLTSILCILIAISYFSGYFQTSFLLPFLLCLYAIWIWNEKSGRVQEWFYQEHHMREHRRRALDQSETVEWLNFLLNRWWFFSDNTIHELLKRGIDPVLESAKPKFVDSIELDRFTLGNRTPFFKYLRVYDTSEDLRKQMASEVLYRNPPTDLPIRPKYQVVIDADMALNAPESKMIIKTKISNKLGDVDLAIEHFQILGRIQLVLHFNQSIPFPHLAAFSISFVHPPKLNFEVCLLKNIQLMEFPLLRNWISELVNDSLKISLVDPGQVTIPLCNDPELLGRQTGYASGVLTLTIKGGTHGKATDDEQWCSITLDKRKIRTKEITADVQWQEQISMLVHSLQFDKMRIKIKGKRRFGPNYTVVQYVLPLIRLNLEQNSEQDMHLHDDNIEGSDLYIHMNYSSLPILDISNEVQLDAFERHYLEKNGNELPSDVSGVLFVRVHKGVNLIPMDSSGTSDPYVMVFANKDLMQRGHVIEETLNPEWDTMVEFFTLDYTQTTLSFIVQDQNPMVLKNVILADDNDDFMGSCNLSLSKSDWWVFKKELTLVLKFHGDAKKGLCESMKKVGKLQVSVIFRPISSVKSSVQPSKNCGMPLGEPLYQKRTKIDAVTMEAILCSERGSLTVCIHRARKLVAHDLNGRSDPFVVVRLGDLKQEKFKTKIVYRTLNPVWNEQITMAMPQKHQMLAVEVWDKDPFTNERMGVIRFNYNDLVHFGEVGLSQKHWFTLEQARSGEIQLSFNVELQKKEEKSDVGKKMFKSYSIENGLDESDGGEDDYLVLDSTNGESQVLQGEMNTVAMETANESGEDDLEREEEVFSTATDGHVDLSGVPAKYYGIYGKVIEIIGLKTLEDINEVYVKIKLDRHAKFEQPSKRGILNRPDRVLCRTGCVQVENRTQINEYFQTKIGDGISPCIYLVLEVKSDKKGKDVIDSHSMLLRNFFNGDNPATRLIELDNGGKMKLQLGHAENNNTNARRPSVFRRNTYK